MPKRSKSVQRGARTQKSAKHPRFTAIGGIRSSWFRNLRANASSETFSDAEGREYVVLHTAAPIAGISSIEWKSVARGLETIAVKSDARSFPSLDRPIEEVGIVPREYVTKINRSSKLAVFLGERVSTARHVQP